MPTLVDTGFLFALADIEDINHKRTIEVARTVSDIFIVPVTVLPEICYLLDSRLGHSAMRKFIVQMHDGPMQIEAVSKTDLSRILEILNQHADARVDFVDASLVALAERLNIIRILTVDQRHFGIIRPKHCPHFEILP